MSTVKFQGPANFGGFSHGGVAYEPDEDGIIEVPAHVPSDVVASHGLKPAEIKKGPKKLEPLAKSGKGGADDSSSDGSAKVADGDEVKKPEKGAKSAKGGAE